MRHDLTPVERRGFLWLKRDDLFYVAGVRGGKARTCWALAQGAPGLVTAGSRSSPQVNIVAQIARHLRIPCRAHTPQGPLSEELVLARDAGAEIVQHPAGYNNVITARARDDAKVRGWREIPFGMECWEAVRQTQAQVENLPREAKRIVISVGSGMSLAGLLHGLRVANWRVPVLGVTVGADPKQRLDRYAPVGWRFMAELVDAGVDYHKAAERLEYGGVQFDSHYEAKCLSFLRAEDLFWVVGLRQSEAMR